MSLCCYAVLRVLIILQSPRWGMEGWLPYFYCLPDVMWRLPFLVSSSRCCELVCSDYGWYMIVPFPGHIHLFDFFKDRNA